MKKIIFALLSFGFTAPAVAQPARVMGGTAPAAGNFLSMNLSGQAAINNTFAGAPVQYGEVNSNGTMNWPIAAAGGCCRLHWWSDTINVTGNQAGTNVVEANFFNLMISGSGTLTNEAFNIVHPYVYIPTGVTISGYGENFEASGKNDGTVSTIDSYLAQYENGVGTTGTYVAYTTNAINDNTAAGSLANYTGFECRGMTGAGSSPTYDWCLVNRDSKATITTLGGVIIGALGNATAAGTLFIQGPDTAGGTFPLAIKNGSSANVFYVTDAGGATLALGDLGVSSGVVNAQGFKVNSVPGVTCSGTPTGSFAVTNGIVTHC